MNMKRHTLHYLVLSCVMAVAQGAFAEPEPSGEKESEDKYLFHPDESKHTDFETDVDPLHEEALQGFDCMDQDEDGYLSEGELEGRDQCVKNAEERGLEASTRTALILDLMDADRDLRVSKREFNIWNEMRTQQ
ncbi:MAG: hypothetical protein WD623_16405 [Marinobacter sp.]|uniref:hypothetical protein n=1 Tax=Marinobacter sp. TaxID=50741 RepID=UPI0034A058C6